MSRLCLIHPVRWATPNGEPTIQKKKRARARFVGTAGALGLTARSPPCSTRSGHSIVRIRGQPALTQIKARSAGSVLESHLSSRRGFLLGPLFRAANRV